MLSPEMTNVTFNRVLASPRFLRCQNKVDAVRQQLRHQHHLQPAAAAAASMSETRLRGGGAFERSRVSIPTRQTACGDHKQQEHRFAPRGRDADKSSRSGESSGLLICWLLTVSIAGEEWQSLQPSKLKVIVFYTNILSVWTEINNCSRVAVQLLAMCLQANHSTAHEAHGLQKGKFVALFRLRILSKHSFIFCIIGPPSSCAMTEYYYVVAGKGKA